MKKFVMALAAAFLISVVFNTIYYAVTAEGHTFVLTKAEPNFALIMLNHVVFALLLVYLFPIFYRDGSSIVEGAKFGALMGLVMFVPTGLVVRGAWDVPITPYFYLDIVMAAVITAIMGIAIGMIYGQKKMTAA